MRAVAGTCQLQQTKPELDHGAIEHGLLRPGMDVRIQRSVALIHLDFRKPLTLTTLAQCSFLSGSRFCHLFKAQVGLSPIKYLKQLRMLQAEAMLTNTNERVKEIVNTLGIRSQSHFLRDFRKYHGIRPSQYRTVSRPRDKNAPTVSSAATAAV